jgi:hypothetical protein
MNTLLATVRVIRAGGVAEKEGAQTEEGIQIMGSMRLYEVEMLQIF